MDRERGSKGALLTRLRRSLVVEYRGSTPGGTSARGGSDRWTRRLNKGRPRFGRSRPQRARAWANSGAEFGSGTSGLCVVNLGEHVAQFGQTSPNWAASRPPEQHPDNAGTISEFKFAGCCFPPGTFQSRPSHDPTDPSIHLASVVSERCVLWEPTASSQPIEPNHLQGDDRWTATSCATEHKTQHGH